MKKEEKKNTSEPYITSPLRLSILFNGKIINPQIDRQELSQNMYLSASGATTACVTCCLLTSLSKAHSLCIACGPLTSEF